MIKIPKAFDACVKAGGRVRTKKLSNGRYIKICFINGKSYAGEVKKAKEVDEQKEKIQEEAKVEVIEEKIQDVEWLVENLSLEEAENQEGVFVTFQVAEAGVSNNNRRYFTSELEKQNLKGLKMFTDHSYEADNAVGIIKQSWMDGRKLMAKAWVNNSAKHPDIVRMLKDGRIDSVSLGGKGEVRYRKEKDKRIEEIHNLQIKEVSFVGIPGVSRAKVKAIGG